MNHNNNRESSYLPAYKAAVIYVPIRPYIYVPIRHLSSVLCRLSSVVCPLHLSRALYKSPLFMQNKPNLRKAKMNVNPYITTDYENTSNWTLGQNKPNSNPILSAVGGFQEPKMNTTLFVTTDYENISNWTLGQSAVGGFRKAKMNLKSLATKSGLSLILLLTIFNMLGKKQKFGFPHLYLRIPVQEGPRLAGTQSTGAGRARAL